ncbi:hypothetical protein CMV30_19005 [Nibricoccus aquaticus]|uniref:Uncharacterized protein n=1 Tax=Nibricoccus aquaticus TaxID=2576891 RepID=A0A290QC89_9BACT|nr:hypothetical protein [Nibricoccus aquaticus]ATC65867.1 hypothetical protein CMV30_19005 [Nibricoccus aquaticus]
MKNNFRPNYGRISFPAFSIPLDRPRVFQFSAQAAERFRALRNFDAADLAVKLNDLTATEAKEVFADLVWASLQDSDRRELSVRDVHRFLTIPSLLRAMNDLIKAVGTAGQNN